MKTNIAFYNHRVNSINKQQNSLHRNNISFGWSQYVKQNPIEEKILDTLTDSSVKIAVTASHIKPDGDAYGSSIGVAGILENMGVKVYTVVNDFPCFQFSNMPSIFSNKTAPEYVDRPDIVSEYIKKDNIAKFDVGVITDCAVPNLTKNSQDGDINKTLDLVSQSKKVIIIDHHPDSPKSPANPNGDTNEELWRDALGKRGVVPENVLYWRELRESASEMIAELDKEITDEAKRGKSVYKYNVRYPQYRIATASGIFTDTGGVYDKNNQLKLARKSEKKVKNNDNKFESTTTYYLKWLLNNSGVNKSKINLEETTITPLPERVKSELGCFKRRF